MNDTEIKALISLIDDEDDEISRHVYERIMSLGSGIIPYLEEEWESNFNPESQRKLEDIIHTLQFLLVKERLKDWLNAGAEDLLKGMWIVSTYQYPDLDFEELTSEFEQLYFDTWVDFGPGMEPLEQIRVLNTAFYSKLKFRSNSKNFHSPSNSMINIVVESRKGNPISLCVVYLLIAQKLKLPVYGVNLPNLFIVGYHEGDTNFYVNVFNKGLIFSREDIDSYIETLQIPPQPQFFEPCSNVDIVKRVFRNLVVAFEKIGDYEKSDEIKQLLQVMGEGIV